MCVHQSHWESELQDNRDHLGEPSSFTEEEMKTGTTSLSAKREPYHLPCLPPIGMEWVSKIMIMNLLWEKLFFFLTM